MIFDSLLSLSDFGNGRAQKQYDHGLFNSPVDAASHLNADNVDGISPSHAMAMISVLSDRIDKQGEVCMMMFQNLIIA